MAEFDSESAPATEESTPVKARIIWPALGFPAVIAPRSPATATNADATRCITAIVISNRRHLSKAEAAAGLRCVPWEQRHRRHIAAGDGVFREEDLSLHHDANASMFLEAPDDKHSDVMGFGGGSERFQIIASLSKHVRRFYADRGMKFFHEIRVSERVSGELKDDVYNLFWNNQVDDEDQPSDEMALLLRDVADPRQQRFTKYWNQFRKWLLEHYEYEYGSLQRSYAFPPASGRKIRAEVLHPVFVKRNLPRRLTIGHMTDLHVDVRNDVYEENLQRAQMAGNFNNWNTSVRRVYDTAKEKCDVLLLTGDLIDYGRGHWGIAEANRLGANSYYIVDRNWSLFYHLFAAGGAYTRPMYTSLGNHDWRINPYPPFAPGTPGPLSFFHHRAALSRKQRAQLEASDKELLKVAHGEGEKHGFSYVIEASNAWQLFWEKTWESLKTTFWTMGLQQAKRLNKKDTPAQTTVDSVAWYLFTINPFLDYSFTLPSGHDVLMLDWGEDEDLLFPITVEGRAYPYFVWQAKVAADPGPKAGRCITDQQKWLTANFFEEDGRAKVIGIHAPPLGPYTDWSDVDLQAETKTYVKQKGNRGPTNYGRRQPNGSVTPLNGHPLYAIAPSGDFEGTQADYGSFRSETRAWFIEQLASRPRGVRLVCSGHIHRNNLLVVDKREGRARDPKVSAVAGRLLVHGVQPALISGARPPLVTAKGDKGPLYVNTTSAGPRGHWYPTAIYPADWERLKFTDPKSAGVAPEDVGRLIYKSVEPGFAEIELSDDGTIHRVSFRSAPIATAPATTTPIAAVPMRRQAIG